MVDYTDLVDQVLANETLSKAASDMARFNKLSLNLVTGDWKMRLENDKRYQDFNTNAQNMFRKVSTGKSNFYNFQNVQQGHDYQIILAAQCRFAKPFDKQKNGPVALIVENSLPLTEIAKAMTSDYGPSIQLANEFKFQFRPCSLLSCFECKGVATQFEEAGYKLSKIHQPCIVDTKIYDGKSIMNRFACHMEDMFQHTFWTLLELKLDVRYDYKDGNNKKLFRIGGKVMEMVAFNDSKLNPSKTVNLGYLQPIAPPVEDGCLNVPSEESEEKQLLDIEAAFLEPMEKDWIMKENDEEKLLSMKRTLEEELHDEESFLEALPDICKKQKTDEHTTVEEEYTTFLI